MSQGMTPVLEWWRKWRQSQAVMGRLPAAFLTEGDDAMGRLHAALEAHARERVNAKLEELAAYDDRLRMDVEDIMKNGCPTPTYYEWLTCEARRLEGNAMRLRSLKEPAPSGEMEPQKGDG